MKLTLEDAQTDFDFLTLPDETIVQLVVEEIELRDVPGKDGKAGWQKFSFKFKILGLPTAIEDEYASLIGTPIWGSVGAKFTIHPDNKLRQWSEALLDIGELDAGFELDTDMLIGRKARGVTGTYPKRDGGRNHDVKGLLAVKPAIEIIPEAAFSFDDEPPF